MTKLFNKNSSIIHLFAALHSIVVILSRFLNFFDDLPLTLFTVLMVVIISIRNRVQIEIMATFSVMGCFLGYILGTYGADVLDTIIKSSTISGAITTFIITQFTGWGTHLIESSMVKDKNYDLTWKPSIKQIVIITLGVIALRIFYTFIFNALYLTQASIYFEFNKILTNAFSQVFLISGNLIFMGYRYRKLNTKKRGDINLFAAILFTSILSLIVAILIYYGFPYIIKKREIVFIDLFRLYTIVLFFEIVVYAIMALIYSGIKNREALRQERLMKSQAQAQYNRLKQQINPHFLFNSLNILDYLIQENKGERASKFIRKLSGIYRYMLRNEGDKLVTIKEELEFANMYIDLLRERFLDGLNIKINIETTYLSKLIVPCSLQILLENAIKHNIVSAENPLLVDIYTQESFIVVKNNLQPRISEHSSTHIGLNNITQQYVNLSGREIVIEKESSCFYVKMPIL